MPKTRVEETTILIMVSMVLLSIIDSSTILVTMYYCGYVGV